MDTDRDDDLDSAKLTSLKFVKWESRVDPSFWMKIAELKLNALKLSEEEIRNMKKERFKTLVLKKIKNCAKEYLISKVWSNSEKLKHVNCMKEYLTSEQLTTDEKKLLFALKTRDVNVKTNFKNMFSKTNMSCRLCNSNDKESEIHILKCKEILSEKSLSEEISKISFSDDY